MKVLRRRLAGLVCLCVLWQVAAYAAAPVMLEYASATDRQDLPECCKLHGPDDTCPMDQARASRRKAGAPSMCDPCCSPDAALLTLLGAVGIPAVALRLAGPDRVLAQATWSPTPYDEFAPVPTIPPPR